ncbi:U32 family peptidase [Alsobacter sp. SYSU M60028]|uniref:Ubiquinone biosynthesis protein UbiV n=1 Tax=Alsobacter ponti TaxID=2962936 RepID=A0ABT1L7Q6_9HYPH|nr:U32 family peptidase [Alsobacter ponti]MCP8937404.1 U32 family peptidase [Alsobacter ponti]
MTAPHTRPTLTLGPVLFHWDGPAWRDFHFRIADEAVIDEVYVGETVCSKRQPFIEPHLPEVIDRFTSAGKRVILSSLTLITLERELRATRDLAGQDDFLVEANDLAALRHLAGRPHAVGPIVNVYNAPTAALLAQRGAQVICLPPELPANSIRQIASATPQVAFEVFAFGRVPLAISARCAHARARGLHKDNCQFVCGQDPDGLRLDTLDAEPFLAINGVQTVSHACQSLVEDLDDLVAMGVRRFRLSPQRCDMVAVAQIHRDVLDGRLKAMEARASLAALYPEAPFSNGFLHGVVGAAWVEGRHRLPR